MSPLRIAAAILILASGVILFATDEARYFAPPLIVGNLLVILDHRRSQAA